MNLVKHGSDPSYILLKILAVQIQCVLYWIQYNLMFLYLSDLNDHSDLSNLSDLCDLSKSCGIYKCPDKFFRLS